MFQRALKTKVLLASLAIAAMFALAACGSDDSSSSSSAGSSASSAGSSAGSSSAGSASDSASAGASGGSSVDLSEKEFTITPADSTAAAGDVSFKVSNDGGTVHNLELEGVTTADGEEAKTEDLQPGSSGDLTVNLKPGTYTYFCDIADHRAEGMEGTITVK